MEEDALRAQIISVAKQMNKVGINQGKSGNLSARISGGMLITPSSIEYDNLKQEDIVFVNSKGYQCLEIDSPRASSEWKLHSDIFSSRRDVGAVLHCHSIYATALACHSQSIPSFHYMVAIAGGVDIRCARYATFGTEKLSTNALKALEGRDACLLAHHGLVALGKNLVHALNLAVEVEVLAKMYLSACQLGEPPSLDKTEMHKILDKFKTMNYNL